MQLITMGELTTRTEGELATLFSQLSKAVISNGARNARNLIYTICHSFLNRCREEIAERGSRCQLRRLPPDRNQWRSVTPLPDFVC